MTDVVLLKVFYMGHENKICWQTGFWSSQISFPPARVCFSPYPCPTQQRRSRGYDCWGMHDTFTACLWLTGLSVWEVLWQPPASLWPTVIAVMLLIRDTIMRSFWEHPGPKPWLPHWLVCLETESSASLGGRHRQTSANCENQLSVPP